MTQLEAAQTGKVTEEMEKIAVDENIDIDELRLLIAAGKVVIPANINHRNRRYYGIGSCLRVKVNANIGTSPQNTDIDIEIEKIKMIERFLRIIIGYWFILQWKINV